MLITVNLLPPELRKKERPSLASLIPVAAAVLVVTLSAGAFAYMHFIVRGEAESARDAMAMVDAQLQPEVKYVAKLRAEESDYKSRGDTIVQIAASRVLWSRKLTQLIDVIEADDGGNRFLVWIKGFDAKPSVSATVARGKGKADGKVKDEVSLDLVCFSEGQALSAFNQFHSDLKGSPLFIPAGGTISPPAGAARFFDDKYWPQHGWASKVLLSMNQPEPVRARPMRAN